MFLLDHPNILLLKALKHTHTITFDTNGHSETEKYMKMMVHFSNRGIYYEGWTAVTHHSTPWPRREWLSFDADERELYDTTKDWNQPRDLLKEKPDKLREQQELFLIEAAKHNDFPLNDRRCERFNAAIAGRSELPGAHISMLIYPDMMHLMENTVLNAKIRFHTITAEVDVTDGETNGEKLVSGVLRAPTKHPTKKLYFQDEKEIII